MTNFLFNTQTTCPTQAVRYQISVTTGTSKSKKTDITLVPSTRVFVASYFSQNADGWTILGKESQTRAPTHDPTSRGQLNQFISGQDMEVKTLHPQDNQAVVQRDSDESKWYFVAPAKFYTGGIHPAYGGTLEFDLGMACGDVNNFNKDDYMVVFRCATCGPLGTGTTLVYGKVKDVLAKTMASQKVTIPLSESGWKKDPENTQAQVCAWSESSSCPLYLPPSLTSPFVSVPHIISPIRSSIYPFFLISIQLAVAASNAERIYRSFEGTVGRQDPWRPDKVARVHCN